MVDADNVGQFGGVVLRPFKMVGEELKVNDSISPEQFQSVPVKNVRAIVSAGLAQLHTKPQPQSQPKDYDITQDETVNTKASIPANTVDKEVVHEVVERVEEEHEFNVDDKVSFQFDGKTIEAKIIKFDDARTRAIVQDADGRLKVDLSVCTKIEE